MWWWIEWPTPILPLLTFSSAQSGCFKRQKQQSIRKHGTSMFHFTSVPITHPWESFQNQSHILFSPKLSWLITALVKKQMFDYDFREYQRIIREWPRNCCDLQEKFNYFSCSTHKKQRAKRTNKSGILWLWQQMNLEDFMFINCPHICCLVTQLCPTLCNPMDSSMPGFPVLHYLPKYAPIHVHWVSDAI